MLLRYDYSARLKQCFARVPMTSTFQSREVGWQALGWLLPLVISTWFCEGPSATRSFEIPILRRSPSRDTGFSFFLAAFLNGLGDSALRSQQDCCQRAQVSLSSLYRPPALTFAGRAIVIANARSLFDRRQEGQRADGDGGTLTRWITQ
jgi:hypothetical protein